MASTLQLMPGQSPPVAIITPTDQRGVLWIVAALCLVTAVLSLLIRGYVRAEFSQSYGHDDVSILGAFVRCERMRTCIEVNSTDPDRSHSLFNQRLSFTP